MEKGPRKLRFRTKLFITYFTAFILILITSWYLTYSLISKGVDDHLSNRMEMALDSIHGIIVSTANQSIKNQLKSIVDGQKRVLALNLENAKQGYVTEKTARDRALQQLAAEIIGTTGYLYCIDSKGIVQVHPDTDLIGKNVYEYEFIKQQLKSKKGYLEYKWQKLKEDTPKLKALYMDWFEPWDLIISASCYKDEFQDIVNPKDLSPALSSFIFGRSGFAFIVDAGGGENITPDFEANPSLDKSLMENAPLANIGSNPRGITITRISKNQYNPGPANSFKGQRVIPEYGWTIVTAAYPDEFEKVLSMIKRVFFMTALISILLILVLSFWLSHNLQKPVKKNYEALLLLSSSVFDNSIEGIIVTNADSIIQRVNPAFEEITGFSAKEVIGQNTRVLRSDMHPPEFYKAMWTILNRTGQWSGEVWNRKKSGEPYPEWLSINAMKKENGDISGYVAIFHDMTEIKRSQDKLKFKTYYDTLTKLPNRLLFEDRLEVAITAAQRDNSALAVICLNLDNFKNINQSLGFDAGDQLLKEAGQRISETFKEKTTVSRFGGDQFNIILKDLASPQAAAGWGARLMDRFKTPFMIQQKEIHVGISQGISLFPWDGNRGDALIKNAEIAMHRAKENGKNNCSLFESSMNKRIDQRLEFEAKLRQGVVKKEFRLFYQPKISVKTGKITGMEALIRWYNDEKGLVSPADFIPIAEETGIIIPIGIWVLTETCSQTRAWHDLGFNNLQIAVNLSAVQFRNKDLLKTIQKTLARTGLAPGFLNLEITEGIVMNDVDGAIATMNKIAELGITISLDDFGTGYSSLAYLKRFPISTLKVDQSFVQEIPTSKNDMAIARTIISMAKSLNMTTVAEGIETEEQLKFMRENHCDEIQGYLFSPPVPADQFLTLLEQESKRSGQSV